MVRINHLPLILLFISSFTSVTAQDKVPPEIGAIKWQKDHSNIYEKAQKSKKPVLILFQEVPG